MVKLELNGTKRYLNILMFQMVSGRVQYFHLICLVYIYINELIENLEKSGKGCCVDKQFYGVLVYADNIKLLAPSLTALQSMVDTCKMFGDKNGLFFYFLIQRKPCVLNFMRVLNIPLLFNTP